VTTAGLKAIVKGSGTTLKRLELRGCQKLTLKSFRYWLDFFALEVLNFSNKKLKLSAFVEMCRGLALQLRSLSLNRCQVEDFSPLAYFCALESITLSSTQVTFRDLSLLAKSSGHSLRKVNLKNCPKLLLEEKISIKEIFPLAEVIFA
jgi:Leucine-rich repeat (LRR) protein